MAVITKNGKPTLSTAVPPTTSSLSSLLAGEAIAQGDACYWKASDGKVYRSNGTAANEAAIVDGFALEDCPAGEYLSLYWNVNLNYGTGLTPGLVYLAATAGALDTAATTGGTVSIGRILPDGKRIWLRKSY